MEAEKVVLKFKMNAKGTQHIAYCDEYPQVQGMGNSEGQATAHFWKAFNNSEDKMQHEATEKKKAEKLAQTDIGKKKKAA